MRFECPFDARSSRPSPPNRSPRAAVECAAEPLERRVLLSDVIPVAGEFRVNNHTTSEQKNPAIAMDGAGNFVVTWESFLQDGSSFGIYAQRYNAAGVPRGEEFRVNTHTTGGQRVPAVAMDADGDFVIVWSGPGQGQGYSSGIFARRYNAAGVPQGSEFLVNTFTTAAQGIPDVAMDEDGDVTFAWGGSGPAGNGVLGRRYNAAGVPHGEEFLVNTSALGLLVSITVAMDADGDFVISWAGKSTVGSSSNISARRYNSAGLPQTDEFRVNTFTNGPQSHPSAAMDKAGNLVIAWRSAGQETPMSIFARRYRADGTPEGGEFRVNTNTGFQAGPDLAMDRDGNFVVAWQGYPQDESEYGIYARRYTSAGVPRGTEFLVNTFTTKDQAAAAIAMDARGDFVVAWQSYLQDGSREGIYAQRYAVVPEITSSSFLFESSPHSLRFRFNHDVRDSLGTNDLLVENLTTGQTIPSDQFVLLYDPASDVATFIYVGAGSDAIAGVLPDGRYRATLLAEGIVTPQGASPAGDHLFEFFFLNADANRDGRVNLRDFNILADNFGTSGTDFSRGDFTFDGTTDLEDFDILAARFGQALPGGGSPDFAQQSKSPGDQEMDEQDSLGELLR